MRERACAFSIGLVLPFALAIVFGAFAMAQNPAVDDGAGSRAGDTPAPPAPAAAQSRVDDGAGRLIDRSMLAEWLCTPHVAPDSDADRPIDAPAHWRDR